MPLYFKWTFLLFFLTLPYFSFSMQTIKISVLSIFKPQKIEIKLRDTPPIKIIKQGQFLISQNQKHTYLELESPYPITLTIPHKIKRSYEGKITLQVMNNQILIINHLALNSYLASVVMSEMGSASLEALKAQAVLARTLSYQAIKKNKYKPYHLTDLTDSQAYKGFDIKTLLSQKAAQDTNNLILAYKNKLAHIFYSSTCAGHTSTPYNVWGQKNAGVKSVVCKNKKKFLCQKSPHFTPWQWKVSLKDLSIINSLRNFEVKKIEIAKKSSLGRVYSLNFYSQNQKKTLLAEQFRIEVGRAFKSFGLLKSAFFTFKTKDNQIVFKGQGLGHGVGLCQWGAKELAKQKANFKNILKFYFPNLSLKNKEEVF